MSGPFDPNDIRGVPDMEPSMEQEMLDQIAEDQAEIEED